MSSVTFRPAAPGDEELMLSFIRALADYEHMTGRGSIWRTCLSCLRSAERAMVRPC